MEFLCQSGDLVATFVGAGRALAGTRGHQQIQKSRPSHYQAEVPVSYRHVAPDLVFEIGGRLDGVWIDESEVTLDEIKTTTVPLTEITRDNQPLHWAQARAYGYMYAHEHGLSHISIQLTYLNLDTLDILELRDSFTLLELQTFFQDLLRRYAEWARTIRDWHLQRNASIEALAFPFTTYRDGQRQLAIGVFRAIAAGNNLYVQAPTGIGKTVATLFPALKSLGLSAVQRIFYLTARTVGRDVAEQTLKSLRRKGLRCKVLTLTAKEKCCVLPKPDCRPESCTRARGYYDRVRPALDELFVQDTFDRQMLEQISERHSVCPFEFSLFASLWADVIICDYNYAFDPRVYLRRFFEPPIEPCAFLVDEAHNLPDRAREMFSADLYKSQFTSLRTELREAAPAVARAISRVTPFFRLAGKAMQNAVQQTLSFEESESPELANDVTPIQRPAAVSTDTQLILYQMPADFVAAVRSFLKAAEAALVVSPSAPYRELLLELYFKSTAFVRVSETFDDTFVFILDADVLPPVTGGTSRAFTRRDVRTRLFCVDPATRLQEALKRSRSTIFFSATLLPMNYFFRLFGGQATDKVLKLRSPFAARQLGLFVLPSIRTEFRVREQSHATIAEAIRTIVSSRRGNYLVYFPSYRYLSDVLAAFSNRCPDTRVIVQSAGMDEAARDAFLKTFTSESDETLVGFAVLGGVFGEGIDLRGERLIGTIIVGVGLPQICLERNLIRERFEQSEKAGFAFAYRFPGMNRVMQAAGRVIRTETDRGVVVLIDERFSRLEYRELFPREWEHARLVPSIFELQRRLESFWQAAPVQAT
ncbi:MAG TPA: ATP-dependent DNA helicase [Candidatus Ozemobacteraceae bacterium]|nr:ATP-dependent DNA helicase [Candidatus Ozemobacteraceae bacterium]